MARDADLDERLLDEALAWQREVAAETANRDGFIYWLGADMRHRQAFDEFSLVDIIVDEHSAALRRLFPLRVVERRSALLSRLALIGSVAAVLTLAIAVPFGWPSPRKFVYATTVGEKRRITLAHGTSIDLAPSSKLIVEGTDSTTLKLERGEAFFTIHHDPQRKISVRIGSYEITDIGTKFGLSLADDAIRVGVAQGKVTVAMGGSSAQVFAGEELIAVAGHAARKFSNAIADIGSWRQGRLVYQNMPLSIVVADIARYSGQKIYMEPMLKSKRFSGVLTINDGSDLLGRLAKLMALSWRVENGHLRLSSGPGSLN